MRRISVLGASSITLATLISRGVSALAFPAENVRYCSSGFEKPARIFLSTSSMYLIEEEKPEIHFGGPESVTVTVGDRSEEFSLHEPGNTDGVYLFSRESYDSELPSVIGEAGAYLAEVTIDNTKVVIFADRVFWPCEK